MDLESSNCTLEEKLSKAHNVLTSTQALTPQIIQEIFLWFLNRKEEMIRKRNSSKNNLELLYQHLHKCLKTHQMSHVSIHQIKYNIIENLLEVCHFTVIILEMGNWHFCQSKKVFITKT